MLLSFAFTLLGVNEQLRRDDSPNLSTGDVRKLFVELTDILRIPENAANLDAILDVFVAAGWPQATQLVMKLDGLG